MAPYVPTISKTKDEKFSTISGIRVLGIAHAPNNEEASYCALIDEDSEVTDYLKLEHFMIKRASGFLSITERKLREHDREKLKR